MLKVIPEKYFNILISDSNSKMLKNLITCYRTTFSASPIILKEKVTREFVRIIKEESAEIEWRYAFFRGNDLEYLLPEDATLLKDHFLSALSCPINEIMLAAMSGIGKYLAEEDAPKFIIPFIDSFALYSFGGVKTEKNENIFDAEKALESIESIYYDMVSDFDVKCRKILLDTYRDFDENGGKYMLKSVRKIYEAFSYDDFELDLQKYIKMGDIDNRFGDLDDQPF